MPRANGRAVDALREMQIERNYTKHAEGSVLITVGNTKVLCTASVSDTVPRFIKQENKKHGWVTAEYGMLPRATHTRTQREAAKGKQGGRTLEIQRLIGRSLRNAIDLGALGEHTVTIDCDVIQADGGTRTAAITGAMVALEDAVNWMIGQQMISANPIKHRIAAVSVGIFEGSAVLDLNYDEDSSAETDMNVVMNHLGGIVEIQGTAEGEAFSEAEFDQMFALAKAGITEIVAKQAEALAN